MDVDSQPVWSNLSFRWDVAERFDPEVGRRWMADNWHRSFYLAAAYLLFISAGKRFMKERKPFHLDKLLIVWNAALAAFSVLGTYHTLPEFISHVRKYGYVESYCVTGDYYLRKPMAFWVWAFHVSKAPELMDTVFLVLRKKPIVFLHCYHHCTVLLWCWFCFQYWSAPPRWGAGMNYLVHSFMYIYYTLRAAGIQPPKFVAPSITLLQMAQFLACVPLNAIALYRTGWSHQRCDTNFLLALLQQFLYNTYFILFANFFYHAYVRKRSKALAKTE